ncbi:hypothetical protein [Heyndrickxia ginsengihumi]|uniref:hypothetical protein n=1 Tax=Heyndrickxia ginsengihumi TaxID=363870 RepID=UPI003D1B4678
MKITMSVLFKVEPYFIGKNESANYMAHSENRQCKVSLGTLLGYDTGIAAGVKGDLAEFHLGLKPFLLLKKPSIFLVVGF